MRHREQLQPRDCERELELELELEHRYQRELPLTTVQD